MQRYIKFTINKSKQTIISLIPRKTLKDETLNNQFISGNLWQFMIIHVQHEISLDYTVFVASHLLTSHRFLSLTQTPQNTQKGTWLRPRLSRCECTRQGSTRLVPASKSQARLNSYGECSLSSGNEVAKRSECENTFKFSVIS